jgi:hypothetical protein
MFVSCLENADILEEEEQLLQSTDSKTGDIEDKINDIRRQVFALFKFAAELIYAGFIDTSAIIDVISTLISNGYTSFIDFGKIIMVFCGLQQKIF